MISFVKYQSKLQVLAPTLELTGTVQKLEKASKICNKLQQNRLKSLPDSKER